MLFRQYKDVNMNFKSCYEALEKQNEEYISLQNSSEMFIGKTFKVLLSLNIKRIWVCTKMSFFSKIAKKNKKTSDCFFYAKGGALENEKKVAVYSCVTKGYDLLKDPLLYDDELDYYLISDEKKEKKSIWKYLSIPHEACCFEGGMINRFCKLNSFLFFANYDFSIYIDGNIEIVSDIRNLCTIARDSKIGIAMHLHDNRDCVYIESSVCKLYKRGNIPAIEALMKEYRQEGFPEHFGMVEATIIIVDLKNPIAKKIMGEWWKELLRSHSGRDQLSFPYVLWKNGYHISDVGCLGNNRRRNPKFRTRLHG